MQKIIPFLWFDGRAEEAMNFYISIFKNSKIISVTNYGDAGPGPKGTVMNCVFQLDGQNFYAFNGGTQFKFSPAMSLLVYCETQEEVDHFWIKLSEGGKRGRCGWLDDKFGVSWQIVPTVLIKLLNDPDPVKSQRVMTAIVQMGKFEIADFQKAYMSPDKDFLPGK
jgi:predicted 3-demethylubiquinone-9 3-methyltransferase (glyoxalase superfamily)